MKKLLVVMLLMSISRFSFAVLTIEITRGSDSALPIAVVPFVNKTGLPISQDVSLIIANDLQRSGDFQTLPVGRMLSLPESMSQVHYRDWRMLGQSYVLVGNVQFIAETNKYDETNTFYFNCAGTTLGTVDYSKNMDMTHKYSPDPKIGWPHK